MSNLELAYFELYSKGQGSILAVLWGFAFTREQYISKYVHEIKYNSFGTGFLTCMRTVMSDKINIGIYLLSV